MVVDMVTANLNLAPSDVLPQSDPATVLLEWENAAVRALQPVYPAIDESPLPTHIKEGLKTYPLMTMVDILDVVYFWFRDAIIIANDYSGKRVRFVPPRNPALATDESQWTRVDMRPIQGDEGSFTPIDAWFLRRLRVANQFLVLYVQNLPALAAGLVQALIMQGVEQLELGLEYLRQAGDSPLAQAVRAEMKRRVLAAFPQLPSLPELELPAPPTPQDLGDDIRDAVNSFFSGLGAAGVDDAAAAGGAAAEGGGVGLSAGFTAVVQDILAKIAGVVFTPTFAVALLGLATAALKVGGEVTTTGGGIATVVIASKSSQDQARIQTKAQTELVRYQIAQQQQTSGTPGWMWGAGLLLGYLVLKGR